MVTDEVASRNNLSGIELISRASSQRKKRNKSLRRNLLKFLCLPLAISCFMLQCFYMWKVTPPNHAMKATLSEFLPSFVKSENKTLAVTRRCTRSLPKAYCHILDRAKNFQKYCSSNISNIESSNDPYVYTGPPIETELPPFGIIENLEKFIANYKDKTSDTEDNLKCDMPPETCCHVDKVSVITMGYKIERLKQMAQHIRDIAYDKKYPGYIEEIILVWNGQYELSNTSVTEDGLELVQMHNDPQVPFRIWYPFLHGLPNNLWNRYHPMIQPKSEAILYFDDDGPFFSPRAVIAGFELWKRHSDTQIGTMARSHHLHTRQKQEKSETMFSNNVQRGQGFVSTCRNQGDWIEYDYHNFPFFDAHMVLPSGSFLHRNYLCFLWHPALDVIRQFIHDHPVHPDDITVSTIIAQLSGKAPRVYPSRVHPPKPHTKDPWGQPPLLETFSFPVMDANKSEVKGEIRARRKLLWNDHSEKDWSDMRSHALNSVLGFFGSVTHGSIGWCYGSQYHNNVTNNCDPPMPPINYIPFLNKGMFEYDICGE